MNGGEDHADQGNNHQNNVEQAQHHFARVTIDLEHRHRAHQQKRSVQQYEAGTQQIIEDVFYYLCHGYSVIEFNSSF